MQSDVLHDMIINSTHTYKHTDFFFFFGSFGKKEGRGGVCNTNKRINRKNLSAIIYNTEPILSYVTH